MEFIQQFGEWLLTWWEQIWGQIDPGIKKTLALLAGIIGFIIPLFGALRAWKMIKAWWRRETTAAWP